MVTGLGVISAPGSDPTRYWERVLSGTPRVRRVTVAPGASATALYQAAVEDLALDHELARFQVRAPGRVVQLATVACR